MVIHPGLSIASLSLLIPGHFITEMVGKHNDAGVLTAQ